MPLSGFALHHHNKNRKKHHKLFHFGKRNQKKIDRFAYVAGIAAPVFTVPQLLEIYIGQTSAGVSLITWSTYLLLSTYWSIYGIIHRQKPITVMYISQATIQIFIVTGIIVYR